MNRRTRFFGDWNNLHIKLTTHLEQRNREGFQATLAQLEAKWERILSLIHKMEDLFTHAYEQYENEQQERFFLTISSQTLVRSALAVTRDPPVVVPDPSAVQNVIVQQNRSRPKLDLKKFAGDYQELKGWWEQFDAVIHSDPSLDGAAKFPYLREYLEGSTKDAIRGFTSTNDIINTSLSQAEQ